jgi:hypothetical protein
LPNSNTAYGLPAKLYGYNIVVERTAKVTTKKGATTARSYVLGDTTAFMCSRPGGLVSERASESPSFSTLTFFMKEEMTVEQFEEKKHRKIEYHITEDYDVQVTAPAAGFLFTSCVN